MLSLSRLETESLQFQASLKRLGQYKGEYPESPGYYFYFNQAFLWFYLFSKLEKKIKVPSLEKLLPSIFSGVLYYLKNAVVVLSQRFRVLRQQIKKVLQKGEGLLRTFLEQESYKYEHVMGNPFYQIFLRDHSNNEITQQQYKQLYKIIEKGNFIKEQRPKQMIFFRYLLIYVNNKVQFDKEIKDPKLIYSLLYINTYLIILNKFPTQTDLILYPFILTNSKLQYVFKRNGTQQLLNQLNLFHPKPELKKLFETFFSS